MRKVLPFLILLFSISSSFAQTDSARSKNSAADITYYNFRSIDKLIQVDTGIHIFHRYNPANEFGDPYQHLGNIGSAAKPLLFTPNNLIGYDPGFHQYDVYLTSLENIVFFNPPFPFTHLQYVQGLQNEQVFNATHSQNLRGRYNFGGNYRVITSEGQYRNSRTKVEDLYAYGRFRSLDRRYNALGGFILANIDNNINGGLRDIFIQNDSVFKLDNKETIPVNLTNGIARFNRNNFFFRHTYDLGSYYTGIQDDTVEVRSFYPKVRITHQAQYLIEKYAFETSNPSSIVFPEVLLRTDSTFDLSNYKTISNKVGIGYLGIKSRDADSIYYHNFAAEAFLEHKYHWVNQQQRQFNYQDIIISGRVGSNLLIDRKLNYGAEAAFIPLGAHIGDHLLELYFNYKDTGFKNINLSLTQQLKAPPKFYEQYLSNHHFWELDLQKTQRLSFAAGYKLPFVDIDLKYKQHLVNNYLYLDEQVRPAQLDEVLIVNQFTATHQLKLNNFYFLNFVGMQLVNRDAVVRLPKFLSQHIYYFQTYLFNGVLLSQIGLDVRYRTDYFADKIDVATNHFYVQNEQELSSYPVVDVFANFKVRTARFFVKVTHLNTLLPENGYFLTPGYPARDFNFKFGVSWMLYN